MQRRDRRLGLVLAEPVEGQRGLEHRDALGDQVGAPETAVLLGQRHEAAVGARPGVASCVVEQEEGEQPGNLRVIGRGRQLPRQPDRLCGEVEVAAVSLVEDQVEHLEHGAQVSEPDRGGHR